MKTISRAKTEFQIFLDRLVFVICILLVIEVPLPETKPYIFVSSNQGELDKLKLAVQNFELKKRGIKI